MDAGTGGDGNPYGKSIQGGSEVGSTVAGPRNIL